LNNRALFLDRDGVINRSMVRDGKPFAPTHFDDFEILPGVKEALIKSRQAGLKNIIVTNQPDLSTGKIKQEQFDLIQSYCLSELEIDAIKVCPHTQLDDCDCRKPRPGLITQAASEFGVDISSSYMVGDRWRDIEAGQAAGCKSNFFIDYDYQEKRPDPPYVVIRSLAEAVLVILEEIELLKLRKKHEFSRQVKG
jgi:D-glycero-D-manno-heptose 1,7-bisphosphate phosphatase